MRGKEQSLDEKTTGTYCTCPFAVVDDSMFPLKCEGSMPVKVHFNAKDGKLIVEKWSEEQT